MGSKLNERNGWLVCIYVIPDASNELNGINGSMLSIAVDSK